MNEELTNEVLEAIKKCSNDAIPIEKRLATALLEERAKPKVWDGAPEWAEGACIIWDDGEGQKYTRLYNSERYTRELPKTRARIMAEEIASAKISNEKDLVDIIEQTINTHMKELKWEA